MATVNLHPSGIVSGNQQWTVIGGGAAQTELADSNDSTGIRETNQNQYCVLELDDYTAGGTVDSIRWYVRGAYTNTRSGDVLIQVTLGTENHNPVTGLSVVYFSEMFNLTFNAGYAPQDYYGTARTVAGAGLGAGAWDATSLDALRLDINTSPEDPAAISRADIYKAFVEVTYTAAVTADNATFFGANF